MNDQLPMEISVSESQARRLSEEPPLFLDVRENFELEIAHLSPDLHIPMTQLAERWQDIPRDKPIVAYCHHGKRSLNVTDFLRERGLIQVQSMIGGIDAWSLQVDPTVPRY